MLLFRFLIFFFNIVTLVIIIHLNYIKMKYKHSWKYQNEANILIIVQNLTKRQLITMEQILSFLAWCMLKQFQMIGKIGEVIL